MNAPNIAIVGATGAVGVEILRVLERRNFPVGSLTLLASARSVGKTLEFRGKPYPVAELKADAFKGVDIAFFSAGAGRSREFAAAARDAGAIVIDNSSAFRMAPDVPLVVPEVNAGDLALHKGLIAEARAILAKAPGVKVVDDAAANHFPMPIEASGDLDVHVGRIRRDLSNPNGLVLFIAGDQLLKGAAWNAVQIAEELAKPKAMAAE